MKDINRKIDKFIKAKAASNKKAKANPHLTYKVTNIAASPSTATTKATHGRTFSMTVSFFNPRFENPYPKDFAIRHESGQQKMATTSSPTRYSSPKRDPILQNNDEPVKEDRCSIKCFPSPIRMTSEGDDEYLFDKKSKGEYHPLNSARSSSPKLEGIKTYHVLPSTARDENPRRKLKAVKPFNDNVYNPITQGDPQSVTLVKQRVPPPISEQTKKINDRMSVLPCERPLLSERSNNQRGRVFWDTAVPLGSKSIEREIDQPKPRVGSPKYNRSEGMKSLVGYNFALPFRDEGVSGKCTNVAYSERLKFDCELE